MQFILGTVRFNLRWSDWSLPSLQSYLSLTNSMECLTKIYRVLWPGFHDLEEATCQHCLGIIIGFMTLARTISMVKSDHTAHFQRPSLGADFGFPGQKCFASTTDIIWDLMKEYFLYNPTSPRGKLHFLAPLISFLGCCWTMFFASNKIWALWLLLAIKHLQWLMSY